MNSPAPERVDVTTGAACSQASEGCSMNAFRHSTRLIAEQHCAITVRIRKGVRGPDEEVEVS